MVDSNEQGAPAYAIGYGRPPKETQFKTGQRGNPKGRPPGSANIKTVVERTLKKKISVRKGNKTSKVPMMQAIAETFALKAAQGDRHATAVVINMASKSGVWSGPGDNAATSEASGSMAPARNPAPSDKLFEGIDPDLLSNDEQVELAGYAEEVDARGYLREASHQRVEELRSKAAPNAQ